MYGTQFTRTNTVSVVLRKKERGHHGRIHTPNNMWQSHKDLLHLVSALLRDPAFIISTLYNSLLFLMGSFGGVKKCRQLKMNVAHCWRGLS